MLPYYKFVCASLRTRIKMFSNKLILRHSNFNLLVHSVFHVWQIISIRMWHILVILNKAVIMDICQVLPHVYNNIRMFEAHCQLILC